MNTSKNGRALIIGLEGFRSETYSDPAGKLTVGVGHLITEKELETGRIEVSMPEWVKPHSLNWSSTITPIEIETLLTQDLRRFEYFINSYILPYCPDLGQNRFDALVSFSFNIGTDNFRNSNSYTLLRNREYSKVPGIIKQWNKITNKQGEKVVNNGLVNRRDKEIELFNTPDVVEGVEIIG